MSTGLAIWVAIQRLFFTVVMLGAVVVVVGDAAVDLWQRGSHVLAVLAPLAFPITFIVWPWTHEAFGIPLWWVFIAGTISYSIANAYDRSQGG